MTVDLTISKLREAKEAQRALDAEIALLMGWQKRRLDSVFDPATGAQKNRNIWIAPSGEANVQVPFYTRDLSAAYELAQSVIPDHTAAITWGDVSRAHIDGGPVCSARTPALALCTAVLSALKSQDP